MLQIQSPFQQLFDTNGSPLDDGYVYIGTANANPETSPIAIYWDDAGTIPAAQPLRTLNGYIVRSGTPARVYTAAEDFSMTVKDRQGRVVFSVLDATSDSNLTTALASSSGSSLVGFLQAGANAQPRTVQSKLRDVVNVMDFGAQGNGVADDTVALQSALNSSLGMSAPSAVFLTATGNLSPTAKTTVAGAGRENTFFRTSHASNSVFLSTAQFVTYRDMTIDRSGAVAGTGITHNAVSNLAPLEGLELDRVNINGHNFGISIRDLVLGGIRNSYIQAGGTGVDINNTGVNAVASFWMEHVWIRGNTTVGANIINCKQTRLQQVAFESAGGRTCPKGLSVIGGNAVYLGNCWFEALLFGAEFIGCGTVTFDGGYLDGSALTTRGFYAANASGNTTVIFDGPWQVENLSVTFATADDNSTIIVRTPSLAAYTFQAVNGGKVIYDFDYVKTQTYDPPSLSSNGTTTVNVTVPGASVGDLVTVNFSNGSTDPNLFYWTGTVTGPDTVVVLLRNMHTLTLDLSSGTLTTRVRKRPLTS